MDSISNGCTIGDLEDEAGERFGEHDRLASELQTYLIAAGLDVVEGEAADRRGLLHIENDEQPGGPLESRMPWKPGTSGSELVVS